MAAVIIVLLWTLMAYRFWKTTAEEGIVTANKRVMDEKKSRYEHATEIAGVILDPLLYNKEQNSQELQHLSDAMVQTARVERIIIMDQSGFVIASNDRKFLKTMQDGLITKGESTEETSEGYDVIRAIKHDGTKMGWVLMRFKLN